MSVKTALAPNTVKTALDMVLEQSFSGDQMPGVADATNASVFKQDTTDRAAVITEQFMGSGYFETRSEEQEVSQGNFRVGNQKTISVTNYAKAQDIPKNYFDDEQWGIVNKAIASMGRNARLTRDKNAFSIYNLGFTTVLANDGVALASNSHVTLGGDTVDNLETGGLTEATLNTAILSLQMQKTQDGTLGGHTPKVLLVPPALFKSANEITKSTRRSGTANNDLNYYSDLFPGLMVLQSPFLAASQGGSDSAFWLLSGDHSVTRWVRQALTTDMVPYQNQRNNNYIYKAEYREAVAPISWEGLVGNSG